MSPHELSNLIEFLFRAIGNHPPGTKRNFSWWDAVVSGNYNLGNGSQSILTYHSVRNSDYVSLVWDHGTLFGIVICGFNDDGFCVKYVSFMSASSPGSVLGSARSSGLWNIAKVES